MKGYEVAAVRNHLLSFSVLALLNAHHPGVHALTHHHFSTQKLSLESLSGGDGCYSYLEFEENAIFSSEPDVELELAGKTLSENTTDDDDFLEVGLIRHSNGSLALGSDFSINVKAREVNSFIALESSELQSIKGADNQSFELNLDLQNSSRRLDCAIGWLLYESSLTKDQLPETMTVRALANLSSPDGAVIALQSQFSDVDFKGSLTLSAQSTGTDQTQVIALDLIDSRFHIESVGHSDITGAIRISGDSDLDLNLSNATDRFKGQLLDAGVYNARSKITIQSGAQWITQGYNFVNEFHWGAGGVLDITEATDTVRIKTEGFSDADDSNGTLSNITRVEDGAVLRVAINDGDLGSDHYKLALGNVSPISETGSRVFVEIVDQRTDPSDCEINIGLIEVDNVEDSQPKFFVEAVPHYYESAWGAYKTYGAIGTDGADGYVLTGMVTDRLGPSLMAKNIIDFTAALAVSHEQNADRVFSFVSDRLSQKKSPGLWVDVQTQETELNLSHQSRRQEIKTQAFSIGYDHEVSVPWFSDSLMGLWASRNQTDADIKDASGEMNETALGFYLQGLTENYRLILQGHYGWGDNELKTPGFFGTNHEKLNARFRTDSRSYGLGLYVGFTRPDDSEKYFFEPFMSGYTYWVQADPSNSVQTIRFKTEKLHQSLVKLGLSAGYRLDETPVPINLFAQAAWAHRFGQSYDLIGFENNKSETFETEDLQESWGYLKLAAEMTVSDHLILGARATAYASEVVKPKYEMGLSAHYIF